MRMESVNGMQWSIGMGLKLFVLWAGFVCYGMSIVVMDRL